MAALEREMGQGGEVESFSINLSAREAPHADKIISHIAQSPGHDFAPNRFPQRSERLREPEQARRPAPWTSPAATSTERASLAAPSAKD